MSVRATIILLTLPLFLGLALVNGALLYFQDRAELRQALNEEARVTAVTVAAFVREMDDPRSELASPLRKQALQAALHHVRGIDSLYLILPGSMAVPLKPASTRWNPATLQAPGSVASFETGSGAEGDRWVTAVAPAGHGRFVVSRFSAETLHAHMATVRRDVLAIILLLGLLATGLGLFAARRITRELEANRGTLSQHGSARLAAAKAELLIREARDLAGAVRLMDASREAAEKRRRLIIARKARLRDLAQAIAETQADLFSPCMVRQGACEIALRLCGNAAPGLFFAHARTPNGGTAVIGRCEASSPIDALAASADVRRQIERCSTAAELSETMERLRALYAFSALERHDWCPDDAARLTLIAVTGETDLQRAHAYRGANPGITPEALLAGLDVMLAPDGVFAAIGPAGSGKCGERSPHIGFDRENGAETADVEDFPH